jgi:hypothetical protein
VIGTSVIRVSLVKIEKMPPAWVVKNISNKASSLLEQLRNFPNKFLSLVGWASPGLMDTLGGGALNRKRT